MRRALLAMAACSLLVLAGCGDDSPDDSAPKVQTTPTDIDGVAVGGDFGSEATVDVSPPVAADQTTVQTLVKGTGDTVKAGDSVTVDYAAYAGSTGVVFDSSWQRGSPSTFTLKGLLEGFAKALEGQQVGSRVVAAIAPGDAFGKQGAPQSGIGPDETLVFVADIESIPLNEATGTKVQPPATLPNLTLDDDGHPAEFQKTEKTPTTVKKSYAEVLIKGDGPKVQDGQTITAQYLGQIYPDGIIFDESWSKGAPFSTPVGKGQPLIPCWNNLVPGMTVGSRIVLVCTPDDAYGDQANGNIPKNSTLIFSLDILAATDTPGG